MAVQIGGYIPGFRFALEVHPDDPRVIDSGGESEVVEQVLDAVRTRVTYTGATIGSQWHAQIVPLRSAALGSDPVVTLTTSDPTKATITQGGHTTHVADGDFDIVATQEATPYYPAREVRQPITNTTDEGATAVVDSWDLDPFDVAKHLLILWNTASTYSTQAKEYYLANRPGISGANTLGVELATDEIATQETYHTLRDAVTAWLITNEATKPIRYLLLMPELPTRTHFGNWESVAYRLSRCLHEIGHRTGDPWAGSDRFSCGRYPGTTALVAHLWPADITDFQAYVDKLAAAHDGQVLISGREHGGYQNTHYWYQIFNNKGFDDTAKQAEAVSALEAVNENLTIHAPDKDTRIRENYQAAGARCYGVHANMHPFGEEPHWHWHLTGSENWWLAVTNESFNGRRDTTQGDYVEWTSPGAFGGAGYAACPVAGCCHTEEPAAGVEKPTIFARWEAGWPGIEAAWASRATDRFFYSGDPLVTR